MPKLFSANRGAWLVAAGATLWGTTGTAQALAPPGANPLTVGAVRIVVGALALLALAHWRNETKSVRQWRSWPLKPTLLAAVSMAAYQLFFFAGVARTGVAVGTIVGIGSAPIAAGILGFLARGERPLRPWYLATILAILGCGLLIMSSGSLQIDGLGIFLAIGAGVVYAVYTLLSKDLLDTKPAGAVTAVTFSLGALFLLPILFLGNLSWLWQPAGMLVALHLGIVTVGIGYLLFAIGLKTTSVATAATMTLAEPLTAGMLGIFLLGEDVTPLAFGGIALLFTGLLVLAVQRPAQAKVYLPTKDN